MGYSAERKAAIIGKMLPPNNTSIRQLSRSEGVSEATLYNWRKQARQDGKLAPKTGSGPEGWSSKDKFAAVVETAAMNAAELAQYCRQRGLFVEQIKAWRTACEQAADLEQADMARHTQTRREDKKRIQALERDLARKEKALAEAAALLVLRKKMGAIWSDGEDV